MNRFIEKRMKNNNSQSLDALSDRSLLGELGHGPKTDSEERARLNEERERERKREREKEREKERARGRPAFSRSAIEKENNENGAQSSTLIFPLVFARFSLSSMGFHLAAIVSGAATLVGVAAVATSRTSAAGWRSLPALALAAASATGFVVAAAASPARSEPRQRRLAGQKRERRLPTAVVPARLRAVPRGPEDEACIPEISRDGVELGRGAAARRRKWKRRKRGKANGGGGGGQGREVRRRRQNVEADDGGDEDEQQRQLSSLPYYLGGWPHEADALPPGVSAVLDVTAELPKVVASEGGYLNLRVWDTHGPSPAQIDTAVRWIAEARRSGKKVLVHCAHGHGRSVTVLAAALLAQREEEGGGEGAESCSDASVDAVIAHIQTFRPRAKLNARQRRALEGWLELRKSAKASVK